MSHNQDYVFCDVTFSDGVMSDIAAIRSSHTGVVEAAFSSDCQDIAATIRGLKQTILAEKFDSKYVVIAHNSEVARIAFAKYGEEVFSKRAWIDTAQLAWPLLFSGLVMSRKLEELAVYFKIPVTMGKGAEGNCTMLMRVFLAMMRRYTTALVGENAVSQVGGETLEGLRKMIGF